MFHIATFTVTVNNNHYKSRIIRMNSTTNSNPETANLRLVFIGPPGSGKGTQAPLLKDKYGLLHISTGDLLRAEVAAGTALGLDARKYMDAGALVPDDLIIRMIQTVISKPENQSGFILDGFPRTVNQARELDKMLQAQGQALKSVFEFAIEDRLLISRILGRLVHPASGRSYHVEFNPPKQPMTDDLTGEPLIRRGDDNEETLTKRLIAYHEMTAPVLDYYRERGILHTVDAADKPQAVWAQIQRFL